LERKLPKWPTRCGRKKTGLMKIWKKSSARTVVPHTIHLTKNESCYRYNCSSGEFSRNSNYYWIFDSFLKEEITICVTTDILIEYEEIISKHMGRKIAFPKVETLTANEFKLALGKEI
jgi:hypothetical protein